MSYLTELNRARHLAGLKPMNESVENQYELYQFWGSYEDGVFHSMNGDGPLPEPNTKESIEAAAAKYNIKIANWDISRGPTDNGGSSAAIMRGTKSDFKKFFSHYDIHYEEDELEELDEGGDEYDEKDD